MYIWLFGIWQIYFKNVYGRASFKNNVTKATVNMMSSKKNQVTKEWVHWSEVKNMKAKEVYGILHLWQDYFSKARE